MQVVEGAEVVGQPRTADLADELRRVGGLVAGHRVFGRAGRRPEPPRIVLRAASSRLDSRHRRHLHARSAGVSRWLRTVTRSEGGATEFRAETRGRRPRPRASRGWGGSALGGLATGLRRVVAEAAT